jgi:hypothetical protein
MDIVKILKRRDAASMVVAIVLGLILLNVLTVLTSDLATYLSGIETTGAEWRENVVRPLVQGALQVILLEAVLRLLIYVRPMFIRRKR